MATLWLNNSKLVLDSAGNLVLCNDCPCVDAGTGTGTGTGTSTSTGTRDTRTDCCPGTGIPQFLNLLFRQANEFSCDEYELQTCTITWMRPVGNGGNAPGPIQEWWYGSMNPAGEELEFFLYCSGSGASGWRFYIRCPGAGTGSGDWLGPYSPEAGATCDPLSLQFGTPASPVLINHPCCIDGILGGSGYVIITE